MRGVGGLPERRPDQEFNPPLAPIQPGAQNNVRARTVIIAGPGGQFLVYSPAAGAGNLIGSFVTTAFTDPFGNLVLPDQVDYGKDASGHYWAVQTQQGNINFYGPAASESAGWVLNGVIDSSTAGDMILNPATPGNGVFLGGARSEYALSAVTAAICVNTVAETIIGYFVIPANDCLVGSGYHVTVTGDADATGTPTMTFRLRMYPAATAILTFPAITCRAAHGMAWSMDFFIYFTATGVGGTFDYSGDLKQVLASTTTAAFPGINRAIPADTTGAMTLAITAQWGTADAVNAIIASQGSLVRIVH